VGCKSLKSLNLNKNNNKVKSKPLELRSRVKSARATAESIESFTQTDKVSH
jgi:hypothetical protein